MVRKLRLREDVVEHLETLEEHLQDADSTEDVIETVAWHFAREHGDLAVALDGSIEHTDMESTN